MFKLVLTASLLYSLQYVSWGVSSFAFTSSSSPKRKKISNKTNGGGGFGKVSDSVPIQHTADISEATSNLIEFLTSQKAAGINSGCEIGFSNESNIRGLFATKPFKKGEIICKIPSDLALALSNPELGGSDAPNVAFGGRNFLDMYQNHNVASKTWAPYLNTLPTKDQHFDASPDFFTDEEVEALEFPRAIEGAKTRLNEIAEICAEYEMDFHELQFATWLVSSRSFQISIDAGGPTPDGDDLVSKPSKTIRVMVPFIDMINHSEEANAEVHIIDPEKDEAWFSIRAQRPIKAGKEISITYGTGYDTSYTLLQNYGFVADKNKIDAMMLKKGGDDVIESDGWSTTLEEDENALKSSTLSSAMRKILQFRCKMKSSYPSK